MEINQLKNIVSSVKDEAIQIRRYLHMHPELSFYEFETSKYIKSKLDSYGITYEEVADTGIIAKISGTQSLSNQTVVLRADIDALPIQEKNNSEFDSLIPNVMHACGHDFHTANLLLVLKILNTYKADFSGTILGVFQPAEERIPGGAKKIIESGKLREQSFDIIGVLGLHVSPKFTSGTVAIRSGIFMASADEIFITIKGKGGHGAQPHLNIDPVVIASNLVVSLQQIVSRMANPATPSVLSIGKFIAEGATNVIPSEVYLEGTFRTMDEVWREKALIEIEKLIKELPRMYGADVDVEIRRGYPVLKNNEALSQKLHRILEKYHGENQVLEAPIWMAAEDFAYYTHEYPAVFYLVGIANLEKEISAELHSPVFRIDEDAFDQSIGGMVHSALMLLEKEF